MRVKLFALGLALTTALAQATPAISQDGATQAGGWAAVRALTAGEKLVVKTKDGDRTSGRFDSATDLVLVIARGGRKIAVERDRIQRVQLNRGTSRTKGTLVGAGIGAGGGAIIGGSIYNVGNGDIIGSIVPGLAAVGAGIGAGIGALFGKGNKNITIYEAP